MVVQKRAKKTSKSKGGASRIRSAGRKAPPARRASRASRTDSAGPLRPSPVTPAVAQPESIAPPPNAIGCYRQHLDFTTHAMDEVRRFYTETLGFTDSVHDPRFNYLRVVTGTGASLGFMPPMPGPPEQWRPPREPALYFMVEDVDRTYRALHSQGVGFQQEPTDMPWMHRVAVLKDPEGRLVMLAQVLAGK